MGFYSYNCRGCGEDGCHLWIHDDGQVLLDHHFLVPGLHLQLDPVNEVVAQDSCAHVGRPLLRRLGQLDARLRQVLVDLRVVVVQELADLLDAEALILWNVHGPDLGGPNHLLLLAHELAKEIDYIEQKD